MASRTEKITLFSILVVGTAIVLSLLFVGFQYRESNLANDSNTSMDMELPDPLEAGWQGEPVCEVLKENEHILKCVFPPGTGHEKHYHLPHTGYTLAGGKFRITDSTGTREVNVPTGTVFSKEEISTHEVLNIGETTSEYLIIEYLK